MKFVTDLFVSGQEPPLLLLGVSSPAGTVIVAVAVARVAVRVAVRVVAMLPVRVSVRVAATAAVALLDAADRHLPEEALATTHPVKTTAGTAIVTTTAMVVEIVIALTALRHGKLRCH